MKLDDLKFSKTQLENELREKMRKQNEKEREREESDYKKIVELNEQVYKLTNEN